MPKAALQQLSFFQALQGDARQEALNLLARWQGEGPLAEEGEQPRAVYFVAAGEVRIEQGGRISRLVEGPAILGLPSSVDEGTVTARMTAASGAEIYELSMAQVRQLMHRHPGAVIQELSSEIRRMYDRERDWLGLMSDHFESPNAGIMPGPYAVDPYPMLFFLLRGDARQLKAHLPQGLRPIPIFDDLYLLTFGRIGRMHTSNPAGRGKEFGYSEAAPFIPCLLPAWPFVGVYCPELYPDRYLAITIGRELYGFPKRFGKIRQRGNRAALYVGDRLDFGLRWRDKVAAGKRQFYEALVEPWLGCGNRARLYGSLAKRFGDWLLNSQRMTMPVFVHKKIPLVSSGAQAHYLVNELVEVPFHVDALEVRNKLNEVRVHSQSDLFSAKTCLAAFELRIGFRFGAGRTRREYDTKGAWPRARGVRSPRASDAPPRPAAHVASEPVESKPGDRGAGGLGRFPIFAHLSSDRTLPQLHKAIERRGRDRQCVFAPGTVIELEGELGSDLLILEEGEVAIDQEGMLTRLARAPELIGLLAAIDGGARTATLTAHGEVRMSHLPVAALWREMSQDPRLAENIAEQLAREARRMYLREADWLAQMAGFFALPQAQILSAPYEAKPHQVTCLLMQGATRELARQLPDDLQLIEGLEKLYLLCFSAIDPLETRDRAGAAWGLSYNETATLIPCAWESGGTKKLGFHSPEWYPDNYLAITIGRELYGLPKRFGRTEFAERGVDLLLDNHLVARVSWRGSKPTRATAQLKQLEGRSKGLAELQRFARLLDELGEQAGEGKAAALPLFVRRRVPDASSETRCVYEIDRLAELPLERFRMEAYAQLEGIEAAFRHANLFLRGRCLGGFRCRVSYVMGREVGLKDYR